MIAVGKWITKHKALIIILSLLLIIPSVIGMAKTRTNYDLLSYLPDSLETVSEQDIMVDEFGILAGHVGFTAFVPTDSILANKYGIHSIQDLYRKACEIYDVMYPEDVDKEGHRFENLSDSVNPLRRFIEYHIMDRKIQGWNYLTPLNDIGIMTTLMNPVDWYETLLPHTMLKIEKLTMLKYADADPMRERYINRRRDDEYRIRGALIQKNVENEYSNQAINGWYFYVDDILARFQMMTLLSA